MHHNWIVQEWPAYAPRTMLQSWGFASMGFGVGGVLGAKLAAPDRPAVAVVGDGGFLLHAQRVATAVQYDIPAVWMVWNNGGYVSIRDQQRGYFGADREYATSFAPRATGRALPRRQRGDGARDGRRRRRRGAPGRPRRRARGGARLGPPDGARRARGPRGQAARARQLGPAAATASRSRRSAGTPIEPAASRPAAVGALTHGLAILDLYSADEPELGVGEMARRLGVHRSSASRLAAALSAAGYLRPAGARGRYALGGKLARLSGLVAPGAALADVATPVLRELVAKLGETGHIAALDGTEVMTTVVVDGWRSVRMHSTVGKRSPAHATAIGKVLLAALGDDEVRRRYGTAALERRTPATVASVGRAPGPAGRDARAAGARSTARSSSRACTASRPRCATTPGRWSRRPGISGPVDRITAETREDLAADVRAAAATISQRLGARAS